MSDTGPPHRGDRFDFRLAAGALLVGVNAWIAASAFEPLAGRNGRIGYALVSASFVTLAVSVVVAAALVWASGWWLRTRAPMIAPAASLAGWIALPLVALANLLPAVAGRIPALSYVLYDLRVGLWILVGAVIWRRLGLSVPRFVQRRAVPAIALAALAVATAVIFTPDLRFSAALHGDEPKYLRFCENFYQGFGFDLSAKRRITDPEAHADVFGNVALLGRALREEAPLLADDVARWLRGQPPRSPTSQPPTPDMFFAGKHPPSVYQLHNPGLSFLLFPGYYLDRSVTGGGVGYQAEVPARLPAVNVTLLAFYAALGLSMWSLLRAHGSGQRVAWGVAAAATLVLPAAAFPFQIYPEIPAAVIVALSIRRLLRSPDDGSATGGLAYGLAVGFLPWLHVRFAMAAVVLAAGAFVMPGTRRGSRWRVAAGTALGLVTLSLYTYRLTGSLVPTATYGSDAPLTLSRVLHGIPAFAFDRTYGLIPHSPLFLLALPGFAILWRTDRRLASILSLLVAAIVLPAAGHGFWAGGGTPGRYLVAAVPVLALCLGHSVASFAGSRWFRAALTALAMVSLETAIRYNLHHHKEVGPLVAPAFSGWRLNLLFPSMGTTWSLSPADAWLLAGWSIVAAVIVAAGVIARSRDLPDAGNVMDAGLVPHTAAVLLFVAGLAAIAGTLTGEWTAAAYLPSRADARARLLTKFGDLSGCAICYTSGSGATEPTRALGNEPGFVDIRPPRGGAVAGRPLTLAIRPRTATGDYMFGDLLIDFGDGTTATFSRHFGDLEIGHAFARPGAYLVRVSCGWGGRQATGQLSLAAMGPE